MSEVQRGWTTILRKEGTDHQKVEGNEDGRTIRIKADINEQIGIRLYSCMHFYIKRKVCFDGKIGMICFKFYHSVQVDARLWI